MFGNKRLAKRSIVGTKISAKCQDGRFYAGVIQALRSPHDSIDANNYLHNYSGEFSNTSTNIIRGSGHGTATSYSVKFENGKVQEVNPKNIIGPGFQSVSSVHLPEGQKVYITLNGREVTGTVQSHDQRTHEVTIIVRMLNTGDFFQVNKKLEDVRLLESRKSARLVDQDQDYSKLADFQPEVKKRAVSHNIEVPSKTSRYRRSMGEEIEPGDDEMEVMDERMAALVLTSLSCSPASPKIPSVFGERSQSLPESQQSSSLTSSGVFSFNSDRSDPSPPLPNNTSLTQGAALSCSWPQDEGLDLEANVRNYFDEFQDEPKRKKAHAQVRTVFQCTWPGCVKIHNTCSGIEKHVRIKHLRREDSESDGEEEFYYTEIEVVDDTSCLENTTELLVHVTTSPPTTTNILPPTNTSSHIPMSTSTPIITNIKSSEPIAMKAMVGIHDHDYQKKEHRYLSQSVDSPMTDCGNYFKEETSTTIPINMPQIKKSLSWQNRVNATPPPGISTSAPIRVSKPSPQERLQHHQSQSPKCHMLTSPQKCTLTHKKSRSEVRKCRKVYGMENRDMWCTQCKWKKACSRFVD